MGLEDSWWFHAQHSVMTSKERDPRGIIRDYQCVKNGYYLFSAYHVLSKAFYKWCPNNLAAAAAAKSLQSCPTLWDPIDGSPPGSPVPGILQARTLEWVAISFSNAWRWKVKVKSLSRVQLLATPWTAAYQAPLSMGFSRQEYWSGVPLPSLPNNLMHVLFPLYRWRCY